MKLAARKAVQAATRLNVWLYRRTDGRAGGRGRGGLPVLLLTVPGRRTGVPHTVPVVYFEHDGQHVVVGTGMGGSKADSAVVSQPHRCKGWPDSSPRQKS